MAAILAWLAMPLAAADLEAAADLGAEARAANAAGAPLVVLFSRQGCGYCEKVRRTYLAPLAGDFGIVVREVDQGASRALVDFSGHPTTHAAFARREGVRVAPTVAFYDAAGRRLTDPIVGLNRDFYAAYLDAALERARAALRAAPSWSESR